MLNQPQSETKNDSLQIAYQVLSDRRQNYDNLMWQVPTLSLTAQAFLFTTALSGGTSTTGRLISAVLALILSLMSIQLMAKHRLNEETDSQMIEQIEKDLGVQVKGIFPHERPKKRYQAVGLKDNGFLKLSSYTIWIIGLNLFAFAALAIIVLTISSNIFKLA